MVGIETQQHKINMSTIVGQLSIASCEYIPVNENQREQLSYEDMNVKLLSAQWWSFSELME